MNKFQLNDRVEYAVKTNGKERTLYIGYVKRIFRKWLTTYVEVCETKTRRVDTVKLKDIFAKVEKKPYYKQSKFNNNAV